jgi:hypothetical protein
MTPFTNLVLSDNTCNHVCAKPHPEEEALSIRERCAVSLGSEHAKGHRGREALAFDPETIGRKKYNSANAALRRACDRLWRRELIIMRHATQRLVFWFGAGDYERTAIGLTQGRV